MKEFMNEKWTVMAAAKQLADKHTKGSQLMMKISTAFGQISDLDVLWLTEFEQHLMAWGYEIRRQNEIRS